MADKPNVVIIMTDQQRADISALKGFQLDTTPFLDRLACRGTWFNHAYTSAPVCVPARISMLTGRFPNAHRVLDNRGSAYATYEQDLVDVLHKQGYATALIGKNHSHLQPGRVDHWFHMSHNGGMGEDRTPQERAFDRWLSELNHGVAVEPTPFPPECQGPYRVVSEAQKWIRSASGHPFFLWLSFAEPHNPYQVSEPYFSLFPPEALPPIRVGKDALLKKGFKWQWTRRLGEYIYPNYEELLQRYRANYFGMLRFLDDQVQRFIDFLSDEGIMENTLLIFVSDHGDFVGEYGLMRKGPEMPDLLMRIPLFIVGPRVNASRTSCPAYVSIVDVMPTICEAIEVAFPAGVQGRSLWQLVTGGTYPPQEFLSIYGEQGFGGLHYTDADNPDYEKCLIPGPKSPTFAELNSYSQSGTMRMVCKDDWKLVFDMQGRGQMYNLKTDPLELENLYDDQKHAKMQCELVAELLEWTLKAVDPLPLPKGKYIMKTDPHNYWTPYS